MTPDYAAWIAAYRARVGSTFGRCESACQAMAADFPELRVVAGHVEDALWGRRAHRWCVTPAGAIVDPTSDQYPALDPRSYEEWRPGIERRVGTCMDCGAALMSADAQPEERNFCGRECERRYGVYMRTGVL